MSGKKHEGDRAVSFIDEAVYQWLIQAEEGICVRRFKADFRVENLSKMKVGDVIFAGSRSYEITQIGKKCFSDCVLLKDGGKRCPLAGGVAFGKERVV